MKPSIENYLKILLEKFGRTIFTEECFSKPTIVEKSFCVSSEIFHLVSICGLVAYIERKVYSKEIAELASTFLYEPSIINSTKFQTQLFTRYRSIFSQIFPFKLQSKDLISLYLKKYFQILEDFSTLSDLQETKLLDPEGEKIIFELLSFFANNFNVNIANLKPSQNVPDGPTVIPITSQNPSPQSVKSISHQINEGIYFIPESGLPLRLNPFFTSEGKSFFILRMLTSEGAFYRSLSEEGFRLFLNPDLLRDFGDILFSLGSYENAYSFYKVQGLQNREMIVIGSALNHCINAKELLKQNEPLLAGSEFELALSLKPELPVLYHEVASAYESGNNLQQSAVALNKLLERFPLSDEGYISLGDIYAAKGDWARANRAYDKCLSINPFHPAAGKRKSFIKGKLEAKSLESGKAEKEIEDFIENLSEKVKEKKVRALGREEELKTLLEILSCKDKRNAIIVGDAGVGKTSLIEELVFKVINDEVPESLKRKKFFLLNAGNIIAGARYRGQFEERVLDVLKKVKESGDILVLENIQQIAGSGARGGSLDSASLIKPYLSKGEITIIATTDPESCATIKEKDPSFLKYFHSITLEELPIPVIHKIVSERKNEYEEYHNVKIPSQIFENSIEMVKMSLVDRALPESILDLMDRTCASVSILSILKGREPIVRKEDILSTLSEMSGISFERLSRLTPERLMNLEKLLSERVIGQEEAISKVSRVVRASKLGFDLYPYRPDGVFLFIGPTGVGKTELAKTLARVLFGDEDKLIRIDMSEYMERISTSRLIGTSPGYVGYYDPNQLTDKIRKNPYSVMLFDEIEKADPQVLNIFLQIFDAGRLTDGRGRSVKFNHATVIMTSNLGTEVFSKGRVGFKNHNEFEDEKSHILKEVKKYFTPEFLNRIDDVVVFNPLTEEDVKRIMEIELSELKDKMRNDGKDLILTEKAKFLLAKEGYSYEYGARNLARVLRRKIAEPLAERALEPNWDEKEIVLFDAEKDELTLTLLKRDEFEMLLQQEAIQIGEEELRGKEDV